MVGPSGAGKDTLIAGARARLADSAAYVFPRREITRDADAGGERHIAVSTDEFERRRRAGAYALAWQAHGLGYGVPAGIVDELAAGRTVVVNVSRTVIAEARRRYETVHVVRVAASESARRDRLAARGREDAARAAARLARAAVHGRSAPDDVIIDNDGTAERAVADFTAFLRALASFGA